MSYDFRNNATLCNKCAFPQTLTTCENWPIVGKKVAVNKDPMCDASVLRKWNSSEEGFAFEIGFDTECNAPVGRVEGPDLQAFGWSWMSKMERGGTRGGEFGDAAHFDGGADLGGVSVR